MADSAAETVIGAVVLAVAGGFLFFASQNTNLGLGRGAYEVSASFRKAEGVSVGSDVRIAGVKIGTVRAMDLDPQTFQARLRLALRGDILVPDDSSATISSDGLLGGGYVAIQPGGSDFKIEPGGEIEITQSSISILDLVGRAITGGGD